RRGWTLPVTRRWCTCPSGRPSGRPCAPQIETARRAFRAAGGSMRTRAPRHIGFTLIELLVAAAIIAVLLAVIVPSYLSTLQKRDARREPASQLAQGALSAAARAGGKALRTERTDVRVR